jgi:predicted metal-dependent hydrolase
MPFIALKKAALRQPFNELNNYLFITYIVTSKPKRISVAAGVVHIIISLSCYKQDLNNLFC